MAEKHDIWMSVSDLMTGLMVVFMFIAVSYILKVQKEEEKITVIVNEYQDTRNKIYEALSEEFKTQSTSWDMEIGKDLAVRFSNSEVLFDLGKADINGKFANLLDEFLPKYFNILLDDKYRGYIKEVRIEGHTDDAPIYGVDSYMGNIYLSQQRADNVLAYLRNSNYYKTLPTLDQEQLQYWLTANGLSYGRTLDKDGNETFVSKQPVDAKASRRVEIKIITTSETIIRDIIEKIEK